MSKEEIIEAVKAMTVVELADLVKAIEEEFGVSAVAAAAPAAAGAAAAEEIITLAKLPSRETLLSMLAGALIGNISKLAVALGEVQKQKENA